MGHRLHLPVVQTEGGLKQSFPIAGGAGPDDPRPSRQQTLQLPHGTLRGFNGVTLIIGVEGIQKLSFLSNKGKLRSGRSCVDAQIAVSFVGLQILFRHHSPGMTGGKPVIVLLIFKQGFQPGHFEGDGNALLQSPDQISDLHTGGVLRLHGRAHGGKQVRILRVNGSFRRQTQCTDKGLFQLRQEVERPAQKGHAAPDGLAAGKAGNGLIHHCLENGGRQVGNRRPLVNQGLNVRLGEHAAPGGDWIDFLVVRRGIIQSGGIGLQQGSHLVNEGSRTAGADAVHPLFQTALEVDNLGVLAAQLNGNVRLGIAAPQGSGHRHHLLHKGNLQGLSQVDGP